MIRPQESTPPQRVVLGYLYHQRGSTKHWDRAKTDHRPAQLVEHSIPLGPRLANNDEKMVWIEVHTEVNPADDLAAAIDHHRAGADGEFLRNLPGHIILA
jgi:hypothetical protein